MFDDDDEDIFLCFIPECIIFKCKWAFVYIPNSSFQYPGERGNTSRKDRGSHLPSVGYCVSWQVLPFLSFFLLASKQLYAFNRQPFYVVLTEILVNQLQECLKVYRMLNIVFFKVTYLLSKGSP